jgi:pimeloyl-ACP methyl ester carboxylesterase
VRSVEVRDLSRLAAVAARAVVSRVEEMHTGIAGRAFGASGAAAEPVRLTHDTIAGGTYAAVRAGLTGGALAAGLVGAAVASGQTLEESGWARTALALLNGACGDLVAGTAPALAVPMAVRVDGRDVPPRPDQLAAAFPAATPRLAVFLHGLTEDERAWRYGSERHHGTPGVSYGSRLRADLGHTPVYLRYNTGLSVPDNGGRLDRLLTDLVAHWPVPVEGIVLIGHSMGGLVARSALHQAGAGTAAAHRWTGTVGETVTLGTPHLGAPLERGVHRLTTLLGRLPETRPLASVLAVRSVGIKDLRYGTVLAAGGPAAGGPAADGPPTHVPLCAGPRHFVVLATLTRSETGPAVDLFGDLLVPPRSARGDTGDDRRLAFPAGHVRHLGRLHHLDLLNHPLVYEQLHRWLAGPPAA